MERRYNVRSPAVKRLMREAIELREATSLYFAQPLEDNLFEWHFTIRGPPGSDYEGGRYHGRIILPPEYPMKPPSIVLLTPNGRFELGHKICLSASSYHPELWQASWGIRTMLLALIGFMPTDGLGTIGSLECEPQERRRLAQRSLSWTCSTCGSCNGTVLPEEVEEDEKVNEEMEEIVSQMAIKSEAEVNAQFKQQQEQQQRTIVNRRPDQQQQRQQEATESSRVITASPNEGAGSQPVESVTTSSLPHISTNTGPRQRVPVNSEADSNIPATATIDSTLRPATVQKSNLSLVVIFVLIAFIALLLIRRVFSS